MKILGVLLTIALFSCKDNFKISEKKIGDRLIKARFLNDSLIDGEAKIYKNNRLISIEHYKYGIKNGSAVSFYANGNVYDSINFINGLENGYYYVYDSSGSIAYNAYYFNGRKIGPETYFENGKVSEYFFNSFENANLYYSSYDFSGKLIKANGRLVNTQVYSAFKDGELGSGMFGFLVRPPKLEITYQLIERDSVAKLDKVLKTFTSEVFFDTLMPRNGLQPKYFLKADVYDSLEAKRTIFYDEFLFRNQK